MHRISTVFLLHFSFFFVFFFLNLRVLYFGWKRPLESLQGSGIKGDFRKRIPSSHCPGEIRVLVELCTARDSQQLLGVVLSCVAGNHGCCVVVCIDRYHIMLDLIH